MSEIADVDEDFSEVTDDVTEGNDIPDEDDVPNEDEGIINE